MTNKLIIANWKTYITSSSALSLAKKIPVGDDIIVAPSMVHLAFIKEHLPDLNLSAQDVSAIADKYGTYTGETPAIMLAGMGIKYAIIGHSERRNSALDNSQSICAKVSHCLAASITPIICVGETKEERQNGQYLEAIRTQLLSLNGLLGPIPSPVLDSPPTKTRALEERKPILNRCAPQIPMTGDMEIKNGDGIIVAYEPIWSVGTGVLPSTEEISEIMNLIRSTLNIASKLVLVYGGSVNAENAKEIVNISGVDGVLIGKASTNPEHFKSIVDIIR